MHDATQLTVNDRERVLLQARRALEAVQLEMANTQLELDRIQQRIVELRLRDLQQRKDLLTALDEAAKALTNRLLLWDRTYVLRAPVAGVVSLFNYWSDSQFIRSGDDVMNLVPLGRQPPVGRMTITLAPLGCGKAGPRRIHSTRQLSSRRIRPVARRSYEYFAGASRSALFHRGRHTGVVDHHFRAKAWLPPRDARKRRDRNRGSAANRTHPLPIPRSDSGY